MTSVLFRLLRLCRNKFLLLLHNFHIRSATVQRVQLPYVAVWSLTTWTIIQTIRFLSSYLSFSSRHSVAVW